MSDGPAPREVRAARLAADLTQKEAADLVFRNKRMWSAWETGESPMGLAVWTLFCLRVDQPDRLKKTVPCPDCGRSVEVSF